MASISESVQLPQEQFLEMAKSHLFEQWMEQLHRECDRISLALELTLLDGFSQQQMQQMSVYEQRWSDSIDLAHKPLVAVSYGFTHSVGLLAINRRLLNEADDIEISLFHHRSDEYIDTWTISDELPDPVLVVEALLETVKNDQR